MSTHAEELNKQRHQFAAALCMRQDPPSTHQHAHLEMTRRWLSLIAFDIRGASHLLSSSRLIHVARVLVRAETLISLVVRQWSLLTPELGRPDANAMADIESDSRLIALMTLAMGQELGDRLGERANDTLIAFRRWRASLERWSRESGISLHLGPEHGSQDHN